uniref:Integrase core domain containing protein n=1 Tax=Solanum tuberosum TaxID=4113 RepID=M1D8S7_SOLTU
MARSKHLGRGINSTHRTSYESEREKDGESRTPMHTLAIEGGFLKRKRSELESDVVSDPLTRLPELPTPPTPLISHTPEVLPAPTHPPWSMNRLKATCLQNIFKEKPLSTDGVVKRYPVVWETCISTNSNSSLSPEIWKKEARSMASVDFVEVRGHISDLCHQASVPFVAKMDAEVNSTSSTDIRRIEAEYMKDVAERRKKAPVDTSLVVDVESMEADTTQSTPANVPIDIPNPSTFTAPPSATTFRPPLTHAMIYKIGNLAHSADVRASQVKAVVSSMIGSH